jgi:hypothetical protein
MTVVLWLFVVLLGSLPFLWVARATNVWLISLSGVIAAVALGFACVRFAENGEPAKAKAAAAVALLAAEIAIFGVGAGLISLLLQVPFIGVFLLFFAVIPLAVVQWGVAAAAREFWDQEFL